MKQEKFQRLGTVGGQAVLDGVMMKTAGRYAVSVRLSDGTIHTKAFPFHSIAERCRLLALPLVRGCVNFFQMLALGQTAWHCPLRLWQRRKKGSQRPKRATF
jgi:uncharacterized protein YqhQ